MASVTPLAISSPFRCYEINTSPCIILYQHTFPDCMQGDQHNIFDAARNFVNAMVLPETAISQLVQAVETRLPKFAFNVPVTMPEPQPPLNMRVQEGDDPFEISVAFLAQNDLDEGEMLPKMVRVIQGKMRQLGMPVYMNHFLTRNAIIGD